MGITGTILVVAVALASAVAVRIARSIALRRALLDIPNERSSHKQPVPRLGGAAFIPVVLVAIGVGWFGTALSGMVALAFFGGCGVLFGISLLDDFRPLSAAIRFGIQFAAAIGVLIAIRYTLHDLRPLSSDLCPLSSVFRSSAPLLLCASALALWIVGLLNIYNFMDGIDGIAGLQAVVGGSAWFILARELGAPAAAVLGSVLAAGTLGFLTLNWPPA